MEYDSFSEGVELGGLRTKNEIKILIGYLLSRLDTPLKREQLDEIICGEELANYFEMSQALSELADSGNGNLHSLVGKNMIIGEIFLCDIGNV